MPPALVLPWLKAVSAFLFSLLKHARWHNAEFMADTTPRNRQPYI